jgi:probable addiction module antidote protein
MAGTSHFDAAEYLDSQEAIADYLSEAFETGDDHYIAHAIGTVARARGMSDVAREAGLSRENLYKALTEDGKPEFGTIMKVLAALDVQLVAKPKVKEAA